MKSLITLFLILFTFSGCESIRKWEKQIQERRQAERQAEYDYYVDYCNRNYEKGYVIQRCIDRKWENYLLREQISRIPGPTTHQTIFIR